MHIYVYTHTHIDNMHMYSILNTIPNPQPHWPTRVWIGDGVSGGRPPESELKAL